MRKFLVGALVLAAVALPAPAIANHVDEGDVRFKVTCLHSHDLPDDPIVHPDEPGAAHNHEFFGNETTDASTTSYRKLIGGAITTCNNPSDLAGYWQPSVYVDGVRRQPSRMTAYYRRGLKDGVIERFPNGLKIIADYPRAGYVCGEVPSTSGNPLPDIPAECTDVKLTVRFPDCWDGVRRDSPDHREHMAYSAPTNSGGPNVCPSTHSVQVPSLSTFTNYVDLPPRATLSSGALDTVHGDFFNGWLPDGPDGLQHLVDFCLNGERHCGSGGSEETVQ